MNFQSKELKNIGQIIDMHINDVIVNASQMSINDSNSIIKLLEMELARVQMVRNMLEQTIQNSNVAFSDSKFVNYVSMTVVEQKISDRIQIFKFAKASKEEALQKSFIARQQGN